MGVQNAIFDKIYLTTRNKIKNAKSPNPFINRVVSNFSKLAPATGISRRGVEFFEIK